MFCANGLKATKEEEGRLSFLTVWQRGMVVLMKKKLRIFLIVLCSAVLLLSLGRVLMIQLGYWQAEKLYQDLRAQSVQIQAPKETASTHEEALPVVDLVGLKKTNPEVVGWVWIPDTQVNYPIMQGTDNQKYLNINYRLGKDIGGSIFMDYRNSKELIDDNTILYGHNMKNGAMFGGLKKYADSAYRTAHPYVYLITEQGIGKYQIIAAYKTESTSRSYTRNLEGKNEDFLSYIASCAGGSPIELPNQDSRMITLSTCTSVRKTERFVVHAAFVEMHSQETKAIS